MDEANQVRLSDEGKRIYRRHCEAVERSFADAKRFYLYFRQCINECSLLKKSHHLT